MRLLIAEDEIDLSNALIAVLKHNNYSVDSVENGTDALDWGLYGKYDGIILDIMMPGLNGIEVLKRLRAGGINTPVLMLTAKSEIEDRITGLDAGADDYLPKPFSMGELLARIRAMTRRSSSFTPSLLKYADLVLDRSLYELVSNNSRVRLGGKEFQMMEMLMSNPARLISTEQFMERIWGCDTAAEINVVWVYISYLRKKLSIIGSATEIRAVRGVGYTLENSKEMSI